MSTHDYPTREVAGRDINSTMVLVGESGGLSAIYDIEPSFAMPGLLTAGTEHGTLYLDPDEVYNVYDAGTTHVATITKKYVTLPDLPPLFFGTEVEVYDEGPTYQVHYIDDAGTTHVAYGVNKNRLADLAVFRTRKALGLD